MLGKAFAERRREMRFEALEPRLLLSADLVHTVASGVALDASLKVAADVTGTEVVQLVDNPSGTVLDSIVLDQDVNVSVLGNTLGDVLKIGFDRSALAHQVTVNFDGGDGGGNELVGPDQSHSWQLGAPDSGTIDDSTFVSFSKVQHVKGGAGDNTFVVLDDTTTTAVEGGGGTNTLVAADAGNTWQVSGTDSGTLDSQSFSNIQNLTGGSAQDTFIFASGAKVAGTVSGGAGDNTLVAPDQDNSWSVTGADSGTLDGQAFTGIQNLAGGAGADTFTMAPGAQVTGSVDGGGGSDTLVGADQANTWTIGSANGGTLNGTVFADIENLVGGAGKDSFTFNSGGQLAGTITGGGGNDTLAAADGDNTWVISGANAGTLNGMMFSEIENLVGGAGADKFVFTGGSISGSIDGGAGDNTFDYSALAAAVTVDLGAGNATDAGAMANVTAVVGGSGSDTLKGTDSGDTWTVSGQDAGSVAGVTFSGIENLEGGAGADTFVFDTTGGLDGLLDGGLGSDTVAGANRANQWNVYGPDAGTLNTTQYAGIENLLGGSGNDVFALMAAGIVSGGIDGGLGTDTVRGPNRKTSWRFTGQGKGNAGGIASFTGMEAVQGGTDDDVFAFDDGAAFGGTIDGGGGSDTLDYSAYTSAVSVDLAAATATGVSGFTGISDVVGGSAADTLDGPTADTTWTVSGVNSGDVAGATFSSFENLEGAADNQDTFVIEASGSVSGVVDGGPGGFDTIVLDGGTFSAVSYTDTGPQSGTISRDGDVITYAGLEPITDNTSTSTRVLGFSNDFQTITITDAGSGQITVSSTKGESKTFAIPTTSLTINAGDGGNIINLTSLPMPTTSTTLIVNGGAGSDVINVSALPAQWTTNIDGGGGSDTYSVDLGGSAGGTVNLADSGGTGNDSLTVNGTAAGDNITLTNGAVTLGSESVHYSGVEAVALRAGTGDDVITVNSLASGVAYTIDGEGGNDTISLGGISTALDLASGVLTGSGVNLTLQSVEKVQDAYVNIAADSLKTLLDDLETLSGWVKQVVAAGDFASQLPLLFAGDQTPLNLGHVAAFSSAIDAVRANLHSYYNSLSGADFTLSALQSRLRSILDNVTQYAGSIVGDFVPTNVGAGDTANFSISLDGATAVPFSVAFTGSSLTADQIASQIDAAITNSSLSGKILAQATADGRLGFKVIDTNVVNYTVSALNEADAAFSKLGLRLSDTIAAAAPALGALTGSLGKLIQNAASSISLSASNLPTLDIKLPFDLHRTSTFGVDLGKDIRTLKGISFDASAQLNVATSITADLDLGLVLSGSPTFDVTVNSLSAGAQITGPDNLSGDLTIGFLGVHANGSIDLDAALGLSAPVTLSLSQLESGDLGGASIAPTASSFSATLNLSVSAGLKDGASDFNPLGVSLTLSSADPFDPSSFQFSDFTPSSNFADLFSFSNMSPFDMITLLKKIAGSFSDVVNSDLFTSFKIPFVSGAISDALDYVNTFQKAILFDGGVNADGSLGSADDGTALITDLNGALAKAGLADRFVFQGDSTSVNGTTVTLLATDYTVTSFTLTDPTTMGLGGSATTSGNDLSLTATPANFGVDGTLTLAYTDAKGSHSTSIDLTGTSGNTKVGNDAPKLLNASNSPNFHTAQQFASDLVTLLNLSPVMIAPNFDQSTDELTFRLKLDANLPAVQIPLNFDLPLGSFGGFQSSGKLSITPDAGVDLTFGVDLGAGGQLSDSTNLTDLVQPLTVSTNPGFTGGDLNAYALAGRLSADAMMTMEVNTNHYLVILPASDTAANTTAGELASEFNTALSNAHKLVGWVDANHQGTPDTAATDLTPYVRTFGADAVGLHNLTLRVYSATVTSFDFNPPSTSIVARELGFQGETSITSAPAMDVFIKAVKDVPVILGRPESGGVSVPATFNVTMGTDAPVEVTVAAAATQPNRTIIDLVSDINNAIAAQPSLIKLINGDNKPMITVDSQGSSLVFKSADGTAFTITSGANAEMLGLGVEGTVDSSNTNDLKITLSDSVNGSDVRYVSLAGDTTLGDVKSSIESQAPGVTVGFNPDNTALVLTDTTFVPIIGSQDNPNPSVFAVEAVNGSDAGGKLGIIARDAVGSTEKPDGKITGTAIGGIPILDRLFIKAPGMGDPQMLHASLSIDTGAGISGTANFAFVGLNFTGEGAIDASIGDSLQDPGTSPGTDGKITLAEITTALAGHPTTLLAAPTITVDPDHLGHDYLKLTLTSGTGVSGFDVSGPNAWVNFQINSFGDPFHSVAPDIGLTYGGGLGDLLNFKNLSFDNILAMLTQVIGSLDAFESAGPIGSFQIPLVNLSIHDILSNVDKFTAALQSLTSNPAGSLQTLGEKLTEALGVPTLLSLDSGQYLKFDFNFNDSITKGLNLTIPANLLPAGFQLSGSAGLNFSGNLALTLDFGIDLQALTSDPGSALNDIYVYTDTGLSGSASISGTNLSFLAGFGPLAVSIDGGSASINGTFGVDVNGSDKVALSNLLTSITPHFSATASANLPVSFSGLSIGSISIDPGSDVTAGNFFSDHFHVNLALPDLSSVSLFDDLLLSAQGMDTFLSGLQNLLSSSVFDKTIPLIGDQLQKGGQFIEKLREDFVAPYRQAIEAAKNAAQNFADPASNVISGVLFNLLGQGTTDHPGLNLLQKLDGHTGSAQQDYVQLLTNLNYYLAHQTDPHLNHVPTTNETSIEWDFTLGGNYDLGPSVNFDLGLPGLGLSMDGTLNVMLHWMMHVGFGFNFTDGFYMVLGDPSNSGGPAMDVGLTVDLSNGATLTGSLGFLQLTATNDYTMDNRRSAAGQGPGGGDYGFQGTGVSADFSIDFQNSADPTNDHIGFADLGNLSVAAQVKAAAAVELNLTLGLNPGVVSAGVASGMPKVMADFMLDWNLDANRSNSTLDPVDLSGIGNAMQDGLQLVEFDNLRLDAGSFLSDVLGPIVDKVKEVTDPLQPILDVITAPIPVISDLAGQPVSLLDLAASFGKVDPGLIYGVADIIDLINSIPAPGAANLEIPLISGPLTIFHANDSNYSGMHLWDSSFKLSSKAQELTSNLNFGDLEAKIKGATAGDSASVQAQKTLDSMFSGKGAYNGEGGFSFPIFEDPKQILYMLLGQSSNVSLVEYRLPTLDFHFDYSQFFTIFGPLGVAIDGTVGLTINLGFGYDTQGITDFVNSKEKHPELLVDGFYLTDLNKQGQDIPELTFYGGIAAAAELNLGIASAGVAGGIGVEVDFNLHDNNGDGKVRLNELIGNIYDEAVINNDPVFAPLAIFDISGSVFAQLSAFLKIDLFFWSFDHTWNITPKITLVNFDIPFERVPKLGTLSDSNELRLNIGPYADQRLNGDLTDGAETVTVTHVSGTAGHETLMVTSPLASRPQTYDNVSKLIIDGGEGNDNITINGVLSTMNISGGAGNDVITLDAATTGNATIDGGAGDDQITGGSGNDVIYGGLGNDIIYGGAGNDIIFGDAGKLDVTYASAAIAGNDGNDEIHGGAGDDILFGGGGNDKIYGDAGSDILIGDAGTVALTNGLGAWAVDWDKGVSGTMTAKTGGNDEIHGGAEGDYIFGGAGDDTLYGEDGNDRIFGEAGFDAIDGGAGNDIIFGDGWTLIADAKLNDAYPAQGLQPTSGGEADTISGGAGDDIIFGGGGNDTIHGNDGNDTIYGGAGADTLYGDDGNDTIYGQSENDTIYGGAGNDVLSGDAGNDSVYGGSGNDTIFGGFGSDTLDGQGDSDQYIIYTRGGNASDFTTIYDSGTNTADNDLVTIYGTAADDVFLLRAMADAYIPTLDRLHTLIEKFYNLGKTNGLSDAGILSSLEDAITRVYTPNTVPGGLLDTLDSAYPSGLASLQTSITAYYNSYYTTPLTRTAFVAKLNAGGTAIERFNYRNIEEITLNTGYGNDYVASDDTLAVFTINGGEGNDTFQIGQIYNSVRDTNPATANLLPEDVFATLEITRGWLSNGISASMTINGGGGNDDFTVFHNSQPLTLNGGDGDDSFTVRAFALVGSVDDQRARTDMKGDAGADTIKYAVNAPVAIDGGDGFDTVLVIGTEFADDFVITDTGVYGAGLNVTYVNIEKLTVDGAEGDDRYFVLSTDPNVVTEIDGGLGNDTFFTGGSPSNAPIYVNSNDLRGYSGIILNSIENTGTNYDGVPIDGISANVADNNEAFIVVNESGGFSSVTEDIPTPTGVAAEGWAYDTYTVTLTKAFVTGEVVTVHILPQEPSPEDLARGSKGLQVLLPGTDPSNDANWVDNTSLTFYSAGTQTVRIRAAHDTAAEGKQFAIINHKVDDLVNGTTPGQYDGIAMRSVKVQINDDDQAGVIVTRTERPLQVIEGNASFDQTYAVVLTRAPTGSNTVDVTLSSYYGDVTFSGATLIGGDKLTFDATNYNQAQFVTVTPVNDSVKQGFHTDYISHTVTSGDVDTTQTRAKYQLDGDPVTSGVNNIPSDKPLDSMLLADKPVAGTVQVWIDGNLRDASRFLVDGNTLVFLGPDGRTPEEITGKVEVQYDYVSPGYNGVLADRQVVDIADNEVASVVVIQSGGSTDVVEGGATDTYQLVLTQQPTADVTIDLNSINTRTGGLDPDTLQNFAYFEPHVLVNGSLSSTITFTTSNWNVAQTVTVSAINDGKVDGDQIKAFVPSVPTLNNIRGPLIINGASGSGSLSLPAPLLLPLPQQERNVHPSDGSVVAFTPSANPGPGAIDQMTVTTSDLQTVVSNDATLGSIADLKGRTLQLTQGAGTGIVLDPSLPRNLYDRVWLITDVAVNGSQTVLTLQNPSQVDTSDPAVTAPDGSASGNPSEYAITSLSLNFFADERQSVDYMFVYDQGSVADKVGRLTSSDGMVLGFDAGTSTMTLATADLESAARNFANGINDLLHRTLRITAGPGLDRSWEITDIADGTDATTKVVTLTALDSATESPTALSEFSIEGAAVEGRVTGLGMSPNLFLNGFATPGGITYGDIEVVQANLGSGNDNLTIDYTTFWKDHATKRTDPFYTLTMVNTGPGNDVVTVNLADGSNGALSLDTQAGDDKVFGQNSSLPLVVFGGAGNDEIHGGSGADILFGDEGRVDYVDGTGMIVTRLGQTPAQSPFNPPETFAVTGAGTDSLADSAASFPTANGGLAGRTVEAIAPDGTAQFRTIASNTSTVLTLSTDSSWTATPDNTYSYRITLDATTTTLTDPLADFPQNYGGLVGLQVQAISPDGLVQYRTIVANNATTLTVDRAWDVLPDHTYFYRVSMLPENQTDGLYRGPRVVQSVDETVGGDDKIYGGAGADTIIGGAGNDTVQGGTGNDIIAGDGARLDYSPVSGLDGSTQLDKVQTTAPGVGGTDNLSGNAGSDIVMGGAGGDTLYGDDATASAGADDGSDILIGDNGQVEYASGVITRIRTTDTSESTGGADTISGNAGSDYILGGVGGDTIYGDAATPGVNDGNDTILGDNGTLDFNYLEDGAGNPVTGGDTNLATLDLVQSEINAALGGADTISGNAGADMIIGGTGGDTLYGNNATATADASDGADYLIGDNGKIYLVGGAVTYLKTTDASESTGGADTISGNAGGDYILGGVAGDTIYGDAATPGVNDGNDVILGDQGVFEFSLSSALYDGDPTTLDRIQTLDTNLGGVDTIYGDAGNDVIIGGSGGDMMRGNSGDDLLLGDFGMVEFASVTVDRMGTAGSFKEFPVYATTTDYTQGGSDTIYGDAGEDVIAGGAYGDQLDGGSGDDLIFGDNVTIDRTGAYLNDFTNPRFVALQGTQIYDTSSGNAGADLVDTSTSYVYRDPNGTYVPTWVDWKIQDLYHNAAIEASQDHSFGDDYIAGGAGNDEIFGQLGNDTIQGDGSIDITSYAVVADSAGQMVRDPRDIFGGRVGLFDVGSNVAGNPFRNANDELVLRPSVDSPTTDGNDYIEGGGGNDIIFGNQGQDDIIGGSSDLFTLDTPGQRPDGQDLIFGGSGTQIDRNAKGDATLDPTTQKITTTANGHANDSDMILGDNGDIFRLVGVNGAEGGGSGASTFNSFLKFNYDNYPDTAAVPPVQPLYIIARAARLLDYTPGGPDYAPSAFDPNSPDYVPNIGGADEIHGGSGDDFIYGQKGNDVIYGDGQDDNIVGGYGNDWISGGTGQDAVIGDDGRIFTSRNGDLEPLNGVDLVNAYAAISTPGNFQQADTYVAGDLMKSIDLTPFSQEMNWTANTDEFGGIATHHSDDIIYGGLGNDWLHGGSGDDAISGAEALPESYFVVVNPDGTRTVEQSDFNHPFNPGNALGYDSTTGTFLYYDEYNPLRQIRINAQDGTLTDSPAGLQFFLNFNENEGPQVNYTGFATVHTDGTDRIYGDNGNDWLVGGTGRDDMYGGWGNDLINADDNLNSTATPGSADPLANNVPDTNPSYEDRAYGGAGRDVLIANTGGDRLIDWVGEFNSYLVPFAPFGLGTVSRSLQPQLQDYLYALSASDGADYTVAADTGSDPARNGEPFGELGMVIQQDNAWQDQTGGPRDPQAGNIPGGPRDVLRSASFNGPQATSTTAGGFSTVSGFSPDSGSWTVQNGALQVSASSLGGEAVSVFDVGGDPLPGYFEMLASVQAGKPTGGWNANSYLIFDYQSKSDFKFAGLDVSLNKLVMGHRDASGWHVDDQSSVRGGLKADKYYNLLLSVNGVNATLVVNNQMAFTHTYQPRVVDGYSYGLNWGMVGVGSDNSQGAFDNVVVQILPPQITFDQTDDFNNGTAPLFTGGTSGTWSVGNGVYSVTPDGGTDASMLDIGPSNLDVSSYLELSTDVAPGGRAGFVFDRYGDKGFKFVLLDAQAQQVVIGHYTFNKGWVSDATVSATIDPNASHSLDVALKGTTVSVTLDGQVVLGYAFNAPVVDGNFGLLATGGGATFDNVRVKTDDPWFVPTTTANLIAATTAPAVEQGPTVTQSELDSIGSFAISQWTDVLGTGDARLAALGDAHFEVADLAGNVLGDTSGGTIQIDTDAAGFGWFVDSSPASSSEFRVRLDKNVLAAAPDSAAYGHMDLLTVVEHEIGHLLGFEHSDTGTFGVMHEDLPAGTRYLLAPESTAPEAQAPSAPPAFDAIGAWQGAVAGTGIDWKAESNGGWEVKLSPYDTGKPATGDSNLTPFDQNLLAKLDAHKQGADFDRMGQDLLGKNA